MADTNIQGVFGGFDVRSRQLAGTWVTNAYTPPLVAAVWFGGGVSLSTVDRLTISTDTDTASVRGPLSAASQYIAATGNASYGWWAGRLPANSNVDRITFNNDSVAASIRGPITASVYGLAAVTSQTASYFAGGYKRTTVDRITLSNDTVAATIVGSLPTPGSQNSAGVSDSTSYGWMTAGINSGVVYSTLVRITYASDTTTASSRGTLSVGRYSFAASFNTSYGWYGGGTTIPGQTSIVDRLTYTTDTAVASARGPLLSNRFNHAAGGDTNVGYFGGGYNPFPVQTTSSITKITYATDTATSVDVGSRSVAARRIGGTSGGY